MIHIKSKYLGITGSSNYCPENVIETVEIGTEEEVGRRTEAQVLMSEESATGSGSKCFCLI